MSWHEAAFCLSHLKPQALKFTDGSNSPCRITCRCDIRASSRSLLMRLPGGVQNLLDDKYTASWDLTALDRGGPTHGDVQRRFCHAVCADGLSSLQPQPKT